MRPLYDLASVFAAQIRTAEEEAGRVYEPLIGLVTDNKDPQKLGRVKVKFPVLSDRDTSWWAPIIMLGAGKNRGWFFIPEVDDEVLCLFEHGELDRPLVVGALWNGKDKPPDKNPGGNPRRVIKSREGSKIIFDDDEMKLIIEDGTGKGRITFDSNNNKILIEAIEGDVCFQSPKGAMTIVAKSAAFKAGSNIEIHAGQKMQWGTDASATISGSSGLTMSGAKVNINCGIAQMPPAPTADPQDVSDPYEARGEGGSGGGAGTAASSSAPRADLAPSPPQNPVPPQLQSSEQPAAAEQEPPQEEPDDPNHVYVVHSEIKSPSGELLGFEEVVLVKHGTDEVISGPATTDKDGKVSFTMPKQGEYDLKIVDDEDEVAPPVPPGDDKDMATELSAKFIEGGLPLAGETVQISGEGVNIASTIDEDGDLAIALPPGEYEIKVRDQTFKLHTMRASDYDNGASMHEFQLEPEPPPPTEFEKARANRYSPSSRGS